MSNNKQSSVDKEFVSYEEALALKELGFDEPCFGFFIGGNKFSWFTNFKGEDRKNSEFINWFEAKDTSCTSPTFSQAFRWFREKGYENWTPHNEEGYQFVIKWEFEHSGGIEALRKINSHEEAELACLRKLIEIVKGGNK